MNNYIAWLLSTTLRHGYVPKAMLLSYIIPIPKDRRTITGDAMCTGLGLGLGLGLGFCGYVGCHYVTNVSNFGYEPIKFPSLKLIK